jgi:hypothetical protein
MSVVVAFYRSHLNFKARKAQYFSILRRVKMGEEISETDLEELSFDDLKAITSIQIELLRNKSKV